MNTQTSLLNNLFMINMNEKNWSLKEHTKLKLGQTRTTQRRKTTCLGCSLSLYSTNMHSLSNKTLLVNECWTVYEHEHIAGVNCLLTSHIRTEIPVHRWDGDGQCTTHRLRENYTGLLKTVDYFSLKSNIVILPNRNYATSVNKYFNLFYKL